MSKVATGKDLREVSDKDLAEDIKRWTEDMIADNNRSFVGMNPSDLSAIASLAIATNRDLTQAFRYLVILSERLASQPPKTGGGVE